MSRAANPFVRVGADGQPLLELKMRLLLWLDTPPSPTRARAVYDRYMGAYGSRIREFCPTTPGSIPQKWTPSSRTRFEQVDLPQLRRFEHWGYGFSDGQAMDSFLLMFHGSRPSSEPGRASFYRFDFPWDVELRALRQLALDVMNLTAFRSGFAGPYFQLSAAELAPSLDLMFAWAQRYWGIMAQSLDATSWHMLEGIEGINWLTLLGNHYLAEAPDLLERARAIGVSTSDTPNGVLIEVEDTPRWIDRNRNESLGNYAALARALRPVLVGNHAGFGGDKWTEDETLRYLQRFTRP